MTARKSIKGLWVLAVAALFVTAFAYQASAYSGGGSAPFSYTGKIVDVDSDHGFITVQAAQNDELSFKLGPDAAVMNCNINMSGSLTDLKFGDLVTVSWFEENNGTYIATEIDYAGPGMQRC
jgi:hypothetical protein